MLEPFERHDRVEAGCDEAGRGCLAGPVVAAAVILDPAKPIAALNDSKQLSEKKRNELRLLIEGNALAWEVVFISPQKIDEINILNASLVGMHEAALALKQQPDHLLIDGNRFVKSTNYSFSCMIKGDARFQSIAAASILAKTHRDEFMKKIDQEFPEYKWSKNKGYPTKDHRAAIAEIGPSIHHRMSFKLLPDQLSLF